MYTHNDEDKVDHNEHNPILYLLYVGQTSQQYRDLLLRMHIPEFHTSSVLGALHVRLARFDFWSFLSC
jgi:hypothetical protein